ncbi:MAG: hypothetical protein KDA80_24765 [Planctomycetaceae bacterium]|nr:hypothetical protein [Planctomycetaceae bacterium]
MTPDLRIPLLAVAFAMMCCWPNMSEAQEVNYQVTNSGNIPVTLNWVNFEGREELYQTIQPGQTVDQPTFVGHKWRIRATGTNALLAEDVVTGIAQGRNVRPQGNVPMPPPGGGQNASYSITNQGNVAVTLNLLAPNGQEVRKATIPPGGKSDQQTTIGSVWVIRRADTGAEITRDTISSVVSGHPVAVFIPTPPPGGGGQAGNGNVATLQAAANYLNQIRANPAAFANLHASLADADVQRMPALQWNDSLHRAAQRKAQYIADNFATDNNAFAHILVINGQNVGMNQWMREAGYPLVSFLEDSQSNFECLYMEGGQFGSTQNNIAIRAIDSFMREGKNGGHVVPILGRNQFWGPCKDVGIGMATSSSGLTFVSVLVGIYDPFNPDAQPPRNGFTQ